LVAKASGHHKTELIMNTNRKRHHRSVVGSITSAVGPFISPLRSLLVRRVIPDRKEQRNVNGYIVRTRLPTGNRKPGKTLTRMADEPQSERPGISCGPGKEVNCAAASYIAALKLENDIPFSDTTVAPV